MVSSILYLSIYLFFLAYSQPSQTGCLPYFQTRHGPSANLGCRSKTCCKRLAGNAGCKKSPKIHHLHTIAQLCRAISSKLRHILTIRKKTVKQHYLFHMSPQYAELRPTKAEFCWQDSGTPVNFNWFCVLAALLHGTQVVGVSQTSQLWTEGATYSAGRPSRWALAYILVYVNLSQKHSYSTVFMLSDYCKYILYHHPYTATWSGNIHYIWVKVKLCTLRITEMWNYRYIWDDNKNICLDLAMLRFQSRCSFLTRCSASLRHWATFMCSISLSSRSRSDSFT